MPKTVGQDWRSSFPMETSEYTTLLTAILLNSQTSILFRSLILGSILLLPYFFTILVERHWVLQLCHTQLTMFLVLQNVNSLHLWLVTTNKQSWFISAFCSTLTLVEIFVTDWLWVHSKHRNNLVVHFTS